jgi:putative membrane protein
MVLLHAGVGAGGDFWLAWSWDPLMVVALLVPVALYTAGLLRSRGRRGRFLPWWRPTLYYAGWTALALGLVSPVDTFSDELFFMHMIQHMLLTMLGVPLVLLGAPFVPTMRGFPPWLRRRVVIPVARDPRLRQTLRFVTRPLVSLALYVAVLWAWHLPFLYELALTSAPVHILEHATFIAAAVAFWWTVIDPAPLRPRIGYAVRLPYLIAATLQGIALGAYITFYDGVLYPFYETAQRPWGMKLMDDQQLAGLVMWVPGSMMYLLALFIVFGVMLAKEEERVRRQEAAEAGLRADAQR